MEPLQGPPGRPNKKPFRISDYLAPAVIFLIAMVVGTLYFSKVAQRSRERREKGTPSRTRGKSAQTDPAPNTAGTAPATEVRRPAPSLPRR